jgi:hypothetical protein
MSPLFSKLRYKAGSRVCVLDAPSGFEAALASLPETIHHTTSLRGSFDLVQAFFTRKAPLLKAAPKIKKTLVPGGIVWICYPKGEALGTDLNRDILRETLAGEGLTTVAQVAIDDVWSALRCKVEATKTARRAR